MAFESAFRPSRRALLVSGGALFAWSHIPSFANAAGGRDPRLVTIVLRGALDGLGAVAPIGEPAYADLHGPIALSPSGERPVFMLDSFFGLHPAMPTFAGLYARKQALVVHATSTPYRNRSHFDGQDVLESGQPGPGRVHSGWLNRALTLLPTGEKVQPRPRGLGIGAATPLILRGPAQVTGWSPTGLPATTDELETRLLDLYRFADVKLQKALYAGLAIDQLARRETSQLRLGGGIEQAMRVPARGAAKLIAAADGPRVCALAFNGWDTHVNEGGATGRLAQLLTGLDGAIDEFRTALGEAWRQTVIVAITEFGRTAKINGTAGTDHGVGTVAFLAGGAVRGGRVVADWPGLEQPQLYEGRDLKPTTDLRAVLKGILADHLGLDKKALGTIVFPGSELVKPLTDLVA